MGEYPKVGRRRKRRMLVLRIRQEGHRAALAGKRDWNNPYPVGSKDYKQWVRGYKEARKSLHD